jgi:hypothetical protein
MTEKDLKIFFSGTYQLGQAISYLAEMMDEENNLTLQYLKISKNILKVLVQSRHIKKRCINVLLNIALILLAVTEFYVIVVIVRTAYALSAPVHM